MQVCAYTPEDFFSIEPIARACFRDFKYPGQFKWDVFSNLWKPAIESGLGVILRVNDDGVLGVMFGPNQFNGWTEALVNFWYVRPEKRRTGTGRDLLLAAEAIAYDRQCWRILMGHPIGYVKFFQRMGYEPMEVGFQKRF